MSTRFVVSLWHVLITMNSPEDENNIAQLAEEAVAVQKQNEQIQAQKEAAKTKREESKEIGKMVAKKVPRTYPSDTENAEPVAKTNRRSSSKRTSKSRTRSDSTETSKDTIPPKKTEPAQSRAAIQTSLSLWQFMKALLLFLI